MERLAGRVILLWGWQRRLVAFLAGAVATLALAPVDFTAACFISFPVLVWLLDGAVGSGGRLQRLLPAFTTGWCFGFGYFLAGMWWLGAGFLYGNGHDAWALPIAVVGLPALLALFYGLATLVARLLWSDGLGRLAALAFGFGTAEWLRSALLSGFAWNATGYTAMPVPLLMQAAQIIGLFGVSALAVFVFSAPALFATGRHARTGLAVAGVLAAAFIGYGYLRLATPPSTENMLRVRIVQIGSGKVGETGLEDFDTDLDANLRLSGGPDTPGSEAPQLILWPELALPLLSAERPHLIDALRQAVGEGQVLITGTMRAEAGPGTTRRLYDSVIVVDDSGEIADAADKVHLLPLVDRTPFARLLREAGTGWPVPVEEYSAGSGRRLLSVTEGTKVLPLVGSEVIVPGVAAREAGDAALIVNPAGYAGYSGTPAPHQHLRQAQLRAVEAGLPLLLAMPNGISAAIDSKGRIIDALATDASGAINISLTVAKPNFFDIGNIRTRGLTFLGIFGMLAALLSIRGARFDIGG